jgi:hypothetical protein
LAGYYGKYRAVQQPRALRRKQHRIDEYVSEEIDESYAAVHLSLPFTLESQSNFTGDDLYGDASLCNALESRNLDLALAFTPLAVW